MGCAIFGTAHSDIFNEFRFMKKAEVILEFVDDTDGGI
jgi:hypothetical protein